ncbi:hypothetical protein ACFR9U_03265 [Halorientalis brevis]|uniref:PIN domain-containing protein n=1 Tax=Halorientalis brevis TaxID=1126241 RepID=A0ABD6C857_9EURY|nr:hypothetical protein [Halorientalis brevis]
MTETPPDPNPARFVADADVLAADLLVGGPAREALDLARDHSWVTLVASDALLDDAAAVIAQCSTPNLAADWREHVETLREPVDQPEGDHPALASAYNGDAVHLLSFDDRLGSAQAGASLRKHMDVSVREPRAFVTLFDPESLYEVVVGGEYPGPDQDARGN